MVYRSRFRGRSEIAAHFEAIEAEARFHGMAEGLLEFLELRGIELTEPQRELILTCRRETTFLLRLRRAVTAESADDFFGPELAPLPATKR